MANHKRRRAPQQRAGAAGQEGIGNAKAGVPLVERSAREVEALGENDPTPDVEWWEGPGTPRCLYCRGPACAAPRCTDHPDARQTTDGWFCSAACFELHGAEPVLPGSVVVVPPLPAPPEMEIEVSGYCPVQGYARFAGPDVVYRAYFRGRYDAWSFEVWPESAWGGDALPDADAVWDYTDGYGDGAYDAGWMNEAHARLLISWAAERFLDALEGLADPYDAPPVSGPTVDAPCYQLSPEAIARAAELIETGVLQVVGEGVDAAVDQLMLTLDLKR